MDHRGRFRFLWNWTLGILLVLLVYTGAGLAVGGPDVVGSPSFEVLRAWPPGVRTMGVVGLLLAVWIGWAYGRGASALVRALPAAAAYYCLNTLLILAGWYTAGIAAWPALGNTAAMTALWVLLALTIPLHPQKAQAASREP